MNTRIVLLLMVLIGVGIHSARAQYFDKYYGVGPAVSVPLSNRSYIDNVSTRAGRFFYRELINEHVAAGIDVSFAGYNDYIPPAVYQSQNQAIFTDFYNYTDHAGLALAGEYLFRPDKKLIPYVGLAGGASYTRLRLYYNIYSNKDTKWSGMIRPYGGAMVRFGTKTSWGAFAHASFEHALLNAPDYDYKGLSALAFQIGFVYLNW